MSLFNPLISIFTTNSVVADAPKKTPNKTAKAKATKTTPKNGIVACESPSGDFVGKKETSATGKRKGVIACSSPSGD